MPSKERAEDALDHLRLKLLRAELGGAGAARPSRVARERIEMARRALDLRLVDDAVSSSAGIPGLVASPRVA